MCSKAVAGRLVLVKQQLEDWARLWLAEQVVPYLNVDKPGGTIGEQDIPYNLGFSQENNASKPLTGKTCGG